VTHTRNVSTVFTSRDQLHLALGNVQAELAVSNTNERGMHSTVSWLKEKGYHYLKVVDCGGCYMSLWNPGTLP
jgi:hypothetical protein